MSLGRRVRTRDVFARARSGGRGVSQFSRDHCVAGSYDKLDSPESGGGPGGLALVIPFSPLLLLRLAAGHLLWAGLGSLEPHPPRHTVRASP
jgi:hypothetical protein